MLAGYLTLAAVLLGIGLAWSAGVIVFMARSLLHPPRLGETRAVLERRPLYPSDLGAEYQDHPFEIVDEATGRKFSVGAWWIPRASACGRTLIFLHPYADSRVACLAWLGLLRQLNLNVLAIDLRGHGRTDGRCTAGYWERHDLLQIVHQLRAAYPDQTRAIFLHGVELGANVAAATAAQNSVDITGIIIERPLQNFPGPLAEIAFVHAHPGPIWRRLALQAAQRMARADFAQVALDRSLAQIDVPVLELTSSEDAESYAKKMRELIAAALPNPAVICDK